MLICIAKKLNHCLSELVEIPHLILLGVILTTPKSFQQSVVIQCFFTSGSLSFSHRSAKHPFLLHIFTVRQPVGSDTVTNSLQ